MRLGSLAGRAVLISSDGTLATDVAKASNDRFGPSPAQVYDDWGAFTEWVDDARIDDGGSSFDRSQLEAPSPYARQIFAIGLNYHDHAEEAGFAAPEVPPVFTKFVSSFTGPVSDLVLPTETVDWEAELVIVLGRAATNVSTEDAWDHIAGLTAGQDFSERTLQLAGPAPQFSLGKSYPGFAPQGPWLVTVDELDDPTDLAISCSVNGTTVQNGRTSDLIFSIPALVEHLSSVTTLLPGDVIFTGTPGGVGGGRKPPWFLKPGDVVETSIEGIGTLRQVCLSGEGK
jgi:2-keto-4-pentenoate hydratase/2-oxohepta-3-ene-1,7-dioic acid hydratase in catechol pathway